MAGVLAVASVPATPHRPRCHRRGASPGFGECSHRTPRGASGQPLTRWRPGDRRWMADPLPFPPPQSSSAARPARVLRVWQHRAMLEVPMRHCFGLTPRLSHSVGSRSGPWAAPPPTASRQTRRARGLLGYASVAGDGSLGCCSGRRTGNSDIWNAPCDRGTDSSHRSTCRCNCSTCFPERVAVDGDVAFEASGSLAILTSSCAA